MFAQMHPTNSGANKILARLGHSDSMFYKMVRDLCVMNSNDKSIQIQIILQSDLYLLVDMYEITTAYLFDQMLRNLL